MIWHIKTNLYFSFLLYFSALTLYPCFLHCWPFVHILLIKCSLVSQNSTANVVCCGNSCFRMMSSRPFGGLTTLDSPTQECNWGLSGIFSPLGQRENCWEKTIQKMTSTTSHLHPPPPPPPLRSPLQLSQDLQAARASRLFCWGRAAGTICLRESRRWKDFAALSANPDSNPSQTAVPWLITCFWNFRCLQHLCATRTWYWGRGIRHLLTWSSLPPPAPLLSFSSPPTQRGPDLSLLPARPAGALLPAAASTPPPWPPSMRQTVRKRKPRMTLRFLSDLQEMKDFGWWRVSEKDGPNLAKPTRSSSFSLMHQKIRVLKRTFNIEKVKKNCRMRL